MKRRRTEAARASGESAWATSRGRSESPPREQAADSSSSSDEDNAGDGGGGGGGRAASGRRGHRGHRGARSSKAQHREARRPEKPHKDVERKSQHQVPEKARRTGEAKGAGAGPGAVAYRPAGAASRHTSSDEDAGTSDREEEKAEAEKEEAVRSDDDEEEETKQEKGTEQKTRTKGKDLASQKSSDSEPKRKRRRSAGPKAPSQAEPWATDPDLPRSLDDLVLPDDLKEDTTAQEMLTRYVRDTKKREAVEPLSEMRRDALIGELKGCMARVEQPRRESTLKRVVQAIQPPEALQHLSSLKLASWSRALYKWIACRSDQKSKKPKGPSIPALPLAKLRRCVQLARLLPDFHYRYEALQRRSDLTKRQHKEADTAVWVVQRHRETFSSGQVVLVYFDIYGHIVAVWCMLNHTVDLSYRRSDAMSNKTEHKTLYSLDIWPLLTQKQAELNSVPPERQVLFAAVQAITEAGHKIGHSVRSEYELWTKHFDAVRLRALVYEDVPGDAKEVKNTNCSSSTPKHPSVQVPSTLLHHGILGPFALPARAQWTPYLAADMSASSQGTEKTPTPPIKLPTPTWRLDMKAIGGARLKSKTCLSCSTERPNCEWTVTDIPAARIVVIDLAAPALPPPCETLWRADVRPAAGPPLLLRWKRSDVFKPWGNTSDVCCPRVSPLDPITHPRPVWWSEQAGYLLSAQNNPIGSPALIQYVRRLLCDAWPKALVLMVLDYLADAPDPRFSTLMFTCKP